jgi:hypothetical protein
MFLLSTFWTGGVAQVIECLPFASVKPEFKPQSHPKEKKKKKKTGGRMLV